MELDLNAIKEEILSALSISNGPLNEDEICEEINKSPIAVQACMEELREQRLVRMTIMRGKKEYKINK